MSRSMVLLAQLLGLITALLIGAILRFWNLDAKPLWMDEVITAIFSMGRNYFEVPVEQFFSVSVLDQLFQLKPTTCANIAQTVSVQSVHPPLFFCWLHQWLQWVPGDWVWRVRSLSAVAGIGAIAAVYGLNRVAFSSSAGTIAGWVMAVSPFAVYLSQEARHYTIPMLFVIVSLVGLIRIQQDLLHGKRSLKVWLGWTVVNGVSFYVHYFAILAIAAQFFALLVLQIRLRHPLRFWWRTWGAIALSGLGIVAICSPWLSTFASHISRPETDWLATSDAAWWSFLIPLYQFAAGWLVMVVSFPVEYQPIWVIVLAAVAMLLFAGWIVWCVLKGLKLLWNDPKTHWETLILMSFVIGVLVEFFAIVYILGKDITQVPRYNFIYYPAVCALIGASFWKLQPSKFENPLFLYFVGGLSCVFVISNLVFLKPYTPDRVAQNILSPNCSAIVMSYNDFQDIALGLGFALAIQTQEQSQPCQPSRFALVSRTQGYGAFWQKVATLKIEAPRIQKFWAIAPGLRMREFPDRVKIQDESCDRNPAQQYRIGIPYVGYDCR
ncbi:MAG: glycosyltransferase family 39 protein [Phormidium tanganyikae FI6-MK23]|nr:glycosyltransferase family 39 protein [Phormidium tanganyikae FI6-MK23]